MPMTYTVHRAPVTPPLDGEWDSPPWSTIAPLDVASYHPRSSDHRPRTQARLLHTGDVLHVLFRVQDRYVRAACTQHGEKVCRDSCVEIFLRPRADRGYFNIEVNCVGTLLTWYVSDWTPVGGTLRAYIDLCEELGRAVQVYHSVPKPLLSEVPDPFDWRLQLTIPTARLEPFVGPLGNLTGQRWYANLFKCADGTSRPHWASWSPIGTSLNFHDPRYFGELTFG